MKLKTDPPKDCRHIWIVGSRYGSDKLERILGWYDGTEYVTVDTGTKIPNVIGWKEYVTLTLRDVYQLLSDTAEDLTNGKTIASYDNESIIQSDEFRTTLKMDDTGLTIMVKEL